MDLFVLGLLWLHSRITVIGGQGTRCDTGDLILVSYVLGKHPNHHASVLAPLSGWASHLLGSLSVIML